MGISATASGWRKPRGFSSSGFGEIVPRLCKAVQSSCEEKDEAPLWRQAMY
jgi:hypothetical protein